jgi:amino acid adenylation domain-containing protein
MKPGDKTMKKLLNLQPPADIEIKETSTRDIAIIGIGLKLADYEDTEKFWADLVSAADRICSIPHPRKKDIDAILRFKGQDPQDLRFREMAYLDRLDQFDYRFFHLSPKEAEMMDPNQRLFMQTAWKALEDAGYGGEKLKGAGVGVFLGMGSARDYAELASQASRDDGAQAFVSNVPSNTASRLSFFMDWHGPTLMVDTACSSSLTATHLACHALRANECKLALVGTVKTVILPVEYGKTDIDSSDGRTRAFDDSSSGTGGGEGVLAVLLKPLHQALKDEDTIYAVIKGSALNNDGRSAGMTVPNADAQTELLDRAWQDAGIDPRTIRFIEAHGTGTRLGDPIEIDGITKAFSRYTTEKQFCAVGSVKTNFGHLDHAAGLIALVKATLCLQKKKIPPLVHFKKANRNIPFNNSPVYPADRLIELNDADGAKGPIRCGVSAFGLSGINCHIVMEEAPALKKTNVRPRVFHTFEKKRCWLKLPADPYETNLGPVFIKQQPVETPGQVIYGISLDHGVDWLLNEHKVQGQTCLVGTAYFQLLSEVAKKQGYDNPLEVTDLFWENLLVMTPEEIRKAPDRLMVILKNTPKGHAASIVRKQSNSTWIQYASAEIKTAPTGKTDSLEIEKIKARCREISLIKNGSDNRNQTLVEASERWNCLVKTWENEKERLSLLRLNDDFKQDLNRFEFHPPLLDAALSSGLDEPGFLPLMCPGTKLYRPITGETYSYIRYIQKQKSDSSEIQKYDVILSDADGKINAEFKGLTFKRIQTGYQLLSVNWIPEKIQPSQMPGKLCVLGKSERLKPIETFELPGTEKERLVLIELLEKQEISKIIFSPPQSGEACRTLEELETRLKQGVYNLFHLVKALIENKYPHPLDILVVGENTYSVTGDETYLNPENAALAGLAKVIHQEYDNIACKYLDIDDTTTGKQVVGESSDFDKPIWPVAYRKGIRYMEEFNSLRTEETHIEIKEQGVYLITGGLGGIGIEIAKYLAGQNQVKLVLIGRTGLLPRESWPTIIKEETKSAGKIRALLEIEQSGSKVLVISADAANPVQMEKAIKDVHENFGKIDGVIHCAGIAGNGFLFRKEEASFSEVLRPKIQGTWILDRLTREDTPDFFVLCSALTALIGAEGQGDYTAANAYLDAFSAFRNKEGQKTLSINWPAWKETGMAFDWGVSQNQYALKTQDAIAAFHQLLSYDGSQGIIIPPGVNVHVGNLFQSPGPRKNTTTGSKPREEAKNVILSGRENGDYSPMETAVAQVWAEVLGYDEISVKDDYYELGGDSLDANKIRNKLGEKLHIKVSIEEIFNYTTIEKYAAFIEKKYKGSETHRPLEVLDKQPYYPVSAAQRRLYIICQLSKNSTGYNLPGIYFIENTIDTKQLAMAFEKLIARHESFRTSFEMKDGQVVQVIADHVAFTLSERSLDKSELEAYVRKFSRPFDLSKAPLLRVEIVTLETGEHLLLFDVHHITADAFSLQIMLNELNSFYKNEELPGLKIQYKDFAYWQNERFESEEFKAHENYWLKQFEKDIPVLDFPQDFQRPPVTTYEGAVVDFTVDETLFSKVRRFSAKNETTPFMVFLAAFYILFHKYSQQDDIIIAIADLGRNVPEVANIIGMFINHLAIRAYPENTKTLTKFLSEIKELTVNAYSHQEYPFDRLIQKLNLPRDMSREPLTSVTFSYMNFKQIEPDETRPQFRPYEGKVKDSSKFDMSIFATEFPDRIIFAIEYYSAVYSESTMRLFGARFLKTVGELVEKETMIADIDVLIEGEREKILKDFNRTTAEYPGDRCIQELFEAQVDKTPDAAAVDFKQNRMTYRELNTRANQAAHHLIRMGVEPGVIVGICLERSLAMLVGLLGILKAGGAYLPLDPNYPEQRLVFMVKDAQVGAMLTQSSLMGRLPKTQVLCMDSEAENLSQADTSNPRSGVGPGNLAYVIYTSGSTGKPKGVAIEHNSAAVFMSWSKKIFVPEELAGVAASTSINFDLSVFEIFFPLTAGGRIVLIENALHLPSLPVDIDITLINTVPSIINELININIIPASVQVINLAGEALKNDLVQRIYQVDTIRKIYNLYGPTEATTYCIFALMKKGSKGAAVIGRPVDNTQVFILDYSFRPIPIGVPGELYIGGAGLARGYLNRPELTAERFINNPFGDAHARLYKTGDLARFLLDGNIEYLGRMDNQVKIRGFRIETPEIEAALGKHPSISDSAVLVKENTDRKEKELVAYLVPGQGKNVDPTEIRHFLDQWLPGYMIPASFIILDAMPLTPNGKIDRRALSKIEGKHTASENTYVMPQTEAEQQIARLWKKVLQVEKVGIHDNFFEVGGHSLLLLQLQQELQTFPGKHPSMVDLFHYPTIHTLALYLSGEENTGKTAASPAVSKGKDIAVIGMVGRFPGADNVESFWMNLRDGVESVSFFSEEELSAEGIDPASLENPAYVKANRVLEDIELFDAGFFGFTPREAEVIDPQQRLFLECAAEVIEHAGYDTDRIECRVGIFAGVGMNTYLMENLFPNQEQLQSVGDYQLMFSNQNDYITTRASYKLNLKGPSVNIQTACSTSLVAVHLACQSLLNGECEMALAGGVSVKAQQKQGYLYIEGMIVSPDGHCRAFDAGARGTVGGNGIGIVMLKKLDQATADRDCIHAVIKGSAINNDGVLKAGYTAPGIEGQVDVITRAMQGIDPETITYIETHGTGTTLGDPIEIAALTRAYRTYTRKDKFCAVGSVKTNVGHLDAAAGIAGLIKTIQALKYKSLPPSLHFEQPNPEIDFANSPFYVNNKLIEWENGGMPRRAGISSFGIGGTNAHIILEEAPEQPLTFHKPSWQVLLLSAKTESALEKATVNLAEHFRQYPDLNIDDAAFTLNTGRKVFKYRGMLVSRTIAEAAKTLTTANGLWTRTCEDEKRPVIFLFPGQGSQYVNLASRLYQQEPLFRDQVDRSIRILTPLMGVDLRDILYPGSESTDTDRKSKELEQTAVAQPALFVIEYALARLWMAWGIHPTAMLGHSIGEYVAACLAGVFSLEEALELVAVRGRLMQSLPGGAMLSVALSESEIQSFLNQDISLAAVNAPSLCVVSGTTEAVAALENQLTLQEVKCVRLHTSHAFHSMMMDPILPAFLDCLQKIKWKAPQKPYLSNLSGTWITTEQATDPNYWVQHLRFPVRFMEGMQNLLKEPNPVFLEVGPGRTLTTLVKRNSHSTAAPEALFSLSSPKDPDDDLRVFLTALGKLWLAGVSVDWFAFYEKKKPFRSVLPTYPFERQRYWIERGEYHGKDLPVSRGKKEQLADWFYVPSWKISAPLNVWLEEQAPEPACWLLFVDDCGLGDRLIEQLEGLSQEVIRVKAGKKWSRLHDRSYVLNPGRAEDYEILLDELSAMRWIPQTIVHLWSVTPVTQDKNAVTEVEITEQAQNAGFYSLLFLVQALGKQEKHSSLELIAVSNDMQAITGEERLHPEKATLLGPIRTIPHEYPDIRCRSVDVTFPLLKTGWGQRLIDQLLREITTRTDDRIIAYRGNQRWLPSYEPIHPDQSRKKKRNLLKEKGTYLITGGLGGIGLTLAEYLGKNLFANLVLVSRSSFPSRDDWDECLITHNPEEEISQKIHVLQTLEEYGARVWVAQADVANLQQMKNLVTEARERFGPIHGVIHAAGLPGGGVIQRKTPENAAAVLAPKVTGSVVLHTLFKDAELDFILFCSSLNSIFEVFGQVDYCAANVFLDTYTDYLRAQGIPAVSLNWDSWQGVGMAVKTAVPPALREQWEEDIRMAITPQEGLEIFRHVMESTLPRVLVSTRKLIPRLEKSRIVASPLPEENRKKPDRIIQMHQRPELSTPFMPPRIPIELSLVQIWQKILGVEPIGILDDFFALGGDSMLAIGLMSQIKQRFNKELSVATLYQAATVEQQATLLKEQEKALPWSPLVGIQPEGPKPPLFCVHPAGGHAMSYYALSQCLEKDQPLYGFQAYGLEEGQVPYKTAEEMAAFYVQTIKKAFPQGPYQLAGWSFGGLIAFEMAQQFKAQGEEVSFLAIFDTQLSDVLTGGQMATEDNAEIIVNVFSEMIPGLSLEVLRQLDYDGQLRYVIEKSQENEMFPFETDFMTLKRLWEVLLTNRQIIQIYKPKVYDGKITFFQAAELGKGLHFKSSLAWKQFSTEELDLHIIPGNHYIMVAPPQVEVLAEKMTRCLKQVNESKNQGCEKLKS